MKTLKTGKKFLSILLSVLILMSSCVVAFAADDVIVEGDHRFEYSATYEATCSMDGFDIWVCTVEGCTASMKRNIVAAYGHIWDSEPYYKAPTCTESGGEGRICIREINGQECGFVELETYEDPIEHDMTAWLPEAQEGGIYYYYKRNCGRTGCEYYEYETYEGSDERIKYFKVDFENDWVAKAYFTAEDGTKLAYSQWTKAYYDTVTETTFVKEGEKAVYNKAVPTKYKTREAGKYQFAGWEIKTGLNSYEDYDLETPVTSNLTLKAKFDEVAVSYNVAFSGYESTTPLEGESFQFTYQHVAHGEKIQYNPARFCVPQHPDKKSLHYNYFFDGWNLLDEDESSKVNNPALNYKYGDNVTTVPIYSNKNISAHFGTIAKKYKVIYHDYDGNIIYNGNENGCVFEFGTRPEFVPEIDLNDPAFADDYGYYYAFGVKDFTVYKWKDANGFEVDISQLVVPSGTAEYDPVAEKNEWMHDIDKGIIHLYPNIERMAKYYTIEVIVKDIDRTTPAKGASVQITDIVPEGEAAHLITSPYTVGADGHITIRVPYAEPVAGAEVYSITATLDGRTAQGTITTGHILGTIDRVELYLSEPDDEDKDKGCTCICHSFFGKIYITFLNIIYKLTGRKIVCCYDMYIRHGDEIQYS